MGRGPAGGTCPRIATPGSEARLEAVVAQEPQHVLGNSRGRIAAKPNPAGPQICETADGIVDRAVGGEENRVDREVTPGRIRGPIGVERNARSSPISLDVAAQGRNFEIAGKGTR